MVTTTYLRTLRLKHRISLLELEKHCSFSNQYLSMLELGKARGTPGNEEALCAAVASIIQTRKTDLMELEQSFEQYRGRLLETMEVDADEL